MKLIIPVVMVIALTGCKREHSEHTDLGASGSFHVTGKLADKDIDLVVDATADVEKVKNEVTKYGPDLEQIKGIVGPAVKLALKAYGVPTLGEVGSDQAKSSGKGLLNGYGQDISAGLVAALLGSHIVSERRKKKRDLSLEK